MLTKTDLQSIREVIDESIQQQVPSIVDDKLRPIMKDIRSIKRRLTRAHKDIKYMSRKFYEGIVYLGRRVEKIENHLKLPVIEKPPAQN